MSFNDYKKTAVNLLQNLNENQNIISVSSSSSELDLKDYVKELGRAFISLGKTAAILDARVGSADSLSMGKPVEQDGEAVLIALSEKTGGENGITEALASEFIGTAKTKGDILFVLTEPLNSSVAAAIFASKTDGGILIEKKKKSRTDKIEECLAELDILKITPLGFVLV